MSTQRVAKLGYYEIVRPLARGGMAELFLARASGPQGFEKLVALKTMLPEYADDPRCVRLFLDEAKLAAQLDHPNIAQIYDLGVWNGRYCFVMEYVRGHDLFEILTRSAQRGRPLPIEHAVQIARALAAALHYAHERTDADGVPLDIIHRDVSPANVAISSDGTVKLLDFGVAKAATSTLHTWVGTVRGRPEYMAPEQALGEALDRRADVYALGVVLAEMIAGARPRFTDGKPRLAHHGDCPAELAAIVLRALAPDREARYPSAQELQLDLEELVRTHQLAQSPIALATYLRELFADASGTWRDDHIEATVPDGRSTAAAKIAAAKRAQHAEQTQATTNVYRITSTLAARSRHALVQTVLGIAVFVLVLVAAIVVGRSIAGGEHAGNAHARAPAVDHAEHERAEVPPRRPRSSAHRRSTRFVRDER